MRTLATTAVVTTLTLLAACGSSAPTATTTVGAGVEAPSPCPPDDAAGDAAIDWVDFVRLDGAMYSRVSPGGAAPTVDVDLVGAVRARVRCRIAEVVGNPDFRPRDGDASFLPAGTELRRFGTADPLLRLAAEVDGQWQVYEVTDVAHARTGADLLDLGGGVASIDLLDGETGTSVLATVEDPAAVRRVVDAVLAAPVQASASDDLEAPEFIAFHLDDGTSITRAWFRASGVLAMRVQVPPELAAAFPSE